MTEGALHVADTVLEPAPKLAMFVSDPGFELP
jgi:hypothetical protein